MKTFCSSRFLFFLWMIVFSFACQATEDGIDPESTPTVVPAALQHTWFDSWSAYMQYPFDPELYQPTSQTWFRGAADPWSMDPRAGFGLQIAANGQFIWTAVVSTGTGGCQVYVAEYIKGSVQISGNTITFKPTVRRKKYHSVCQPQNAFDRNESLDSFSMTYEVVEGQEGGPTWLRLYEPGQIVIELSR